MNNKRAEAAASPLVVTRNGVPCPDQASALDEFAARCGHKTLFINDVDRVAWAILGELHTNVPEDKRPMSWSDLSDEQAERVRRAASAAIDAIRPFSPFDERLRKALQGCMDAICYESEEAADKGQWALPFEVVIEAKKALADKRLPRVHNERCPECDKPLEPHGNCPQCGEYARNGSATKLIGSRSAQNSGNREQPECSHLKLVERKCVDTDGSTRHSWECGTCHHPFKLVPA